MSAAELAAALVAFRKLAEAASAAGSHAAAAELARSAAALGANLVRLELEDQSLVAAELEARLEHLERLVR